MKDYFELINLKNIFLKKIDKLDIQFQQYGGANFNDEIRKYKSYNDNLEIINNQIYLLLTIKYIEYLIEFIKSLDGTRYIDIKNISDQISHRIEYPNVKLTNLRKIIESFIPTLPSEKARLVANINSDKYNILSGLDEQKIENITGQNNITSLENELQIYSRHNSQLSDIITNNKRKIENLINGNSEKNKIIIDDIETKFIFLLEIIEYILDIILKLKETHNKGAFVEYKEYKIFNYCNTYRYRYTKSSPDEINDKIDKICKLCKLINTTSLNQINKVEIAPVIQSIKPTTSTKSTTPTKSTTSTTSTTPDKPRWISSSGRNDTSKNKPLTPNIGSKKDAPN
jgi:hypothetical protein